MKIQKILLVIALSILLGSCNNSQSSTANQQINETESSFESQLKATNEVQSVYPFPIIIPTENNPYPGEPVQNNQMPTKTAIFSDFKTPEPKPYVANIYGTLKSATNGMALGTMKVYVAEIVPLEPEGGFVYTVQQNSSPQNDTDSLGRFAILDIPEGDYTLIVRTPLVEQLAVDLNGEPIHLILNAGRVYNLNEIFIDWP